MAKLIAITANFINKGSRHESLIDKFGYAYFLKQEFFNNLEKLHPVANTLPRYDLLILAWVDATS